MNNQFYYRRPEMPNELVVEKAVWYACSRWLYMARLAG